MKMAVGTYISIITLNVNRLNAPTKRYRLAEWIQKHDQYIYAVYKKPISDLMTESERMEKYIPCKWETKESWSSNLHVGQNRP